MTNAEALAADIRELYLGNLGTIEFDIELPREGAHGTAIAWESDMPHFLDAEGHVSRPSYGRGNREVTLTATFTNGDACETHSYVAQVLEMDNDIEIASICPVEVAAVAGATCHLPGAVAVTTTDGRTITQQVCWDDGAERAWDEPGTYAVAGTIRDTAYRVEGTAVVAASAAEPIAADERETLTREGLTVRLEGDSDFLAAQERMHAWLMGTDPDTWLYNFRVAAGLDTKGAAQMSGWDSPDGLLRGHSTGHYLSGLARCYAATGDEAVRERLAYLVGELAACNKGLEARGCAEGFLSAYDEEQFDKLEVYTPYPKIWAPYYTFHKILAGLIDAHTLAGVDGALALAHGMGQWAWRRLNRLPHDQLVRMWNIYIAGEYGGMNEALAHLYELTDDEDMLACARLFDNDRLFFPLEQGVDALNGMHANQHIPQIVGAMELFRACGEERYLRIAERFWDELVAGHTYAIGGTGESEMWHAAGDEASMLTASTCESCASYNLMKLTGLVHQRRATAKTMDYYERVLFGHSLATCDHEATGGTTYFISMQPGAHKEFDLLENSCCHGTGMEEPFMYAEHAYHLGRAADGTRALYVELFMGTHAVAEGLDAHLAVDPCDPGKLTLRVSCEEALGLRVRVPSWCEGAPHVVVDGVGAEVGCTDGYLAVDLAAGEHELAVGFACQPRVVRAGDDPSRYMVFYGPYSMAVLSEATEVLELPAAEVPGALEPVAGKLLQFAWAGRDLAVVPFETLDEHAAYHLYLKDGSGGHSPLWGRRRGAGPRAGARAPAFLCG